MEKEFKEDTNPIKRPWRITKILVLKKDILGDETERKFSILAAKEDMLFYYITLLLGLSKIYIKLKKRSEILTKNLEKIIQIPKEKLKKEKGVKPFKVKPITPSGFRSRVLGLQAEAEEVDYYSTFWNQPETSFCTDYFIIDVEKNKKIFHISQKDYQYYQAMNAYSENEAELHNFLKKSKFVKNKIFFFTKYSINFDDFSPSIPYDPDEILIYLRRTKKILYRRNNLKLTHILFEEFNYQNLSDYIKSWLKILKSDLAIFTSKGRIFDMRKILYFLPYEEKLMKYEKYWSREDLRRKSFYSIFEEIDKETNYEKMSRVQIFAMKDDLNFGFKDKNNNLNIIFVGVESVEENTLAHLNLIIYKVIDENFPEEISLKILEKKIFVCNLEMEFFKKIEINKKTGVLEIIKEDFEGEFTHEFYHYSRVNCGYDFIKEIKNLDKDFSIDNDFFTNGVICCEYLNDGFQFERFV